MTINEQSRVFVVEITAVEDEEEMVIQSMDGMENQGHWLLVPPESGRHGFGVWVASRRETIPYRPSASQTIFLVNVNGVGLPEIKWGRLIQDSEHLSSEVTYLKTKYKELGIHYDLLC